ncbi:MAG: alpha/beta fold hydrolase [Paracoccaceae bacterium]
MTIDWVPHTDQWLTVAGKRLEARVWGPPPDIAPTLVMLHEGLGSVGLWRGFPEALAALTGCGVFAWSRAGYGRSDPVELPRPLDYMQREGREVLPLVCDAVGLRRGVLIGHSDGASIAAVNAGAIADLHIRGLVLMAPHLFTEEVGLASIAGAKNAFETGDLRARLARHHKDVDNAFRGWNDAWLDPAFRAWNIETYIARITVPVLAVQGQNDQYGSLAQIEALERGLRVPFSRIIPKDCRHSPHLDQPERTLEAVANFVAGLGMQEGGN